MRKFLMLVLCAVGLFAQGQEHSQSATRLWNYPVTKPTSTNDGNAMCWSNSLATFTYCAMSGGGGGSAAGAAGSVQVAGAAGAFSSVAGFVVDSNSVTRLPGGLLSMDHVFVSGGTPTLACGTGSTIVGNDSVGKITVNGMQMSCTVTFAHPWVDPVSGAAVTPVCTVVQVAPPGEESEFSGPYPTYVAGAMSNTSWIPINTAGTGPLNGDVMAYFCVAPH
jgi:hypothetical protein